MVKQPFFICKDLVHHPIESTVYKWMFRVPAKIHIINKDGSIKHGILYDIWSMQNYRIQKHRICSEYIYICLHLCQTPIRIDKGSRPCSMHVSAKWCFLAKGVTSSLSPRAQNDSDIIPSSKSENSQPRIALPMAHLSLGNLFFNPEIDQVFTKWIIKWITDPLKQPQQTTTKKDNTKSCFQMEFPGFGGFLASRIQTAGSMVPWGSMVKRSRQDAWLGCSEHPLAL